MKRFNSIATLILAGAALVSLAGCQEKERIARGRAVSFKITSGNHDTRAGYSGVVADGHERINWANGDLVRIYCSAAKYGIENSNSAPTLGGDQDQKYADYSISGVTDDGRYSDAKINSSTGSDGKQLLWGDNVQHDFYAVYPSPAATSSWVSSLSDNTVIGTVKEGQSGDGLFSDGMVMVAQKSIASPQGLTDSFNSEVFLQFQPITTAIKFSIKNGQGAAITVTRVELVSENRPLSGQFKYEIGSGAVFDTDISADKTVYISKSATLAANKEGDPYEFTFLLRPDDDLDDLSIVVTTNTPGLTYTAKLQDKDGPYTFKAGSKTEIKGVVLEKWLTIQSISFTGSDDLREEPTVDEEILF